MTKEASQQIRNTTAFASGPALLALLEKWTDEGWIRDLDLAFAHTLQRHCPDDSPLVLLAAALVSHRAGHGHLSLDLAATLRRPAAAHAWDTAPDGSDSATRPQLVLAELELATWLEALTNSAAVGQGAGCEPMVLERGHLQLRRYWRHQQTLDRQIEQRLGPAAPADEARLGEAIARLFPPRADSARDPDWQKIACALAARSRFAVITGGPGTGKTTTVIKLLALLQALALNGPDPRTLRIRLAAPTGKAAARLNESIAGQVRQLDLSGFSDAETLRAAIPTEVRTLHRLLGARPDTRAFRYHADHRLPLDIVVIDEASMIDVELMAALLEALPPRASLVLLGDKDQLASVEAGAVLGNLCDRADAGHYTSDTCEWLQRVTGDTIDAGLMNPEGRPLDQAIAMLRHSHRFGAASGIGALARAINQSDAVEVERILADPGYADVHHLELAGQDDPALERIATRGHADAARGYAAYLGMLAERRPGDGATATELDDWARAVIGAQGEFQLLCALRNGPWGVDGLNARIEASLARADRIAPGPGGPNHWYEGRPVLVTGNDYGLGLMNGDMGITLNVPQRPGAAASPMTLRVAFPRGDGSNGIKWVLPSRLQRCETVYAMTVHKSQGSEFRHVALVLPDSANPVVTKALVYTAATRASRMFTLATGGGNALAAALHEAPGR